jgi:tripartite-type tricarboxylate transporter receptor subunit TctC
VHIPYKGSAPSIAALLASEVQLSFVNPVAIGQFVKTGRLRALGVASAKRTALLPDVPTMKEAGVEGVEVPLWFGLLAPARRARVSRSLATAVKRARILRTWLLDRAPSRRPAPPKSSPRC